MSFFGVQNPFVTQVGKLIEQATDGALASENWGLNMEICDQINETDEGPKDAMKALKKRLSSNAGKNHNIVMYSLTVLETCVKNCGKRFHLQMATKDFLGELIKIIGPKNDPPQVLQEKVLSLIQTWADAFKGIPELKEVDKVYMDLKKKGIEFPMTDLGTMAPIHTPARIHTDPPSNRTPVRVASARAAPPPFRPPENAPETQPAPVNAGPINLTAEQLGKLRSELDVVEQNCKVFSEMLTEMTPGQEDRSDLELLQELHRTCRQMQQRIVELLDRVGNEDVTGELLRVNDDLNNVFLRYERFERYRTGQSGMPATNPAPLASPPTINNANISNSATLPMRGAPPPTAGDAGTGNLIDLETPSPRATAHTQNPLAQPTSSSDLQLRLAGMTLGGGSTVTGQLDQLNSTPATNTSGPQDEFDMFAQSRQSFETSKTQGPGPVGGTPGAHSAYMNQMTGQRGGSLGATVQNRSNLQDDRPHEKDTEYDEMEKWLSENPTQESATSSEFDRFLAERAKEQDDLPDMNTAQRNQRRMKEDEHENALFAL